ncbi:unnamed protein product [Lymnaea stagnalis]|uniref:Uncharacterized protein n=1 Tax=Lymnaea stagnalis TaxID=6523 RepID=A0AAV2H0K0_LYMST
MASASGDDGKDSRKRNNEKVNTTGEKSGPDTNQDREIRQLPSNINTVEVDPLQEIGACALPGDKDNTSAKSFNPEDALGSSSLSLDSIDRLHISDANVNQVSSNQLVTDFGISTRINPSASSIGDTTQDISLASRNSGRVAQHYNLQSCATSSGLSSESLGINPSSSPLAMNIPVSIDGQRMKNTEIPVGMAERQMSFQSVQSCLQSLPGIHNDFLQQKGAYAQGADSYREAQFSTNGGASPSTQRFQSLDDNNINMSVQTPSASANEMTARLESSPSSQIQQPLSHSSSVISIRSEIPSNCLVRRLPRRIIQLVAGHLQVRLLHGTWKDLVELHDWNYERTFLFESQPHNEGIFFSLLREPEFQNYTLENLRQDLIDIPRKDVLHDLNEMINNHNEAATRGSSNQ